MLCSSVQIVRMSVHWAELHVAVRVGAAPRVVISLFTEAARGMQTRAPMACCCIENRPTETFSAWICVVMVTNFPPLHSASDASDSCRADWLLHIEQCSRQENVQLFCINPQLRVFQGFREHTCLARLRTSGSITRAPARGGECDDSRPHEIAKTLRNNYALPRWSALAAGHAWHRGDTRTQQCRSFS
jgi:hypothetical protein